MRKNRYKEMAINMTHNAYSPYSKYQVGACVVSSDGWAFEGCNIENASYGLTLCAERVAIFNAVSFGDFTRKTRKIIEIYIATKDGGYPCGACRQVMAEFCDDDLKIFIINTTTNKVIKTTLGELLPKAFRLEASK